VLSGLGTPARLLEAIGVDLKVDVLGPVRVVRDGVSVPLGGSRETLRTMLGLLVASRDLGLSEGGIADELWGGAPPVGCSSTIRSYATRLRRSLDVGANRSIVLVEHGVYRLFTGGYESDVAEFERLVKLGEDACWPEERSDLLRRALEVPRGRPYANVAQTPLIMQEVARIEELKLMVMTDRIEADIDLGLHSDVIAESQQLVAANPYRERLSRMLVLALYRSGRQVEALRTIQSQRERLREDVGIEPSRRLIGLEHAILVRDPSLDWRPMQERRRHARRRSGQSRREILGLGRQLLPDGEFDEARSIVAATPEEPPGGPNRQMECDMLLGLSQARHEVQDLVGTRSAAIAAAGLAREAGSRSRLAVAALLAGSRNTVGRPEVVVEALCHEALDTLEPADTDLRALVLAALADYQGFAIGDGDAAIETAAEALALANGSSEARVLARCLLQSGKSLDWTSRLTERTLLGEHLVAHGLAHGDIEAECDGLHLRSLACLALGDIVGFESDRLQLEHLTSEAPNWWRDLFLRVWPGMVAMMDGRFDDAEPAIALLLGLGSHEPDIQNLALGQLLFLRGEQGRLGEMRPLVEQHVKREPRVTAFSCALAWILAETGHTTEASIQLRALVGGGVVRVPRDLTWTTSLCLLAETAATVGDPQSAAVLLAQLVAYRGQVAVLSQGVAVAGAFDRYIGLMQAVLGDGAARSNFEAALVLETSLCAPPLVARTKVCFGRWLFRQPSNLDRRRAQTLLGEGRRTALSLGMLRLAAETESQGAPLRSGLQSHRSANAAPLSA
jgi:DNA-binding SARP family transcriptional activator